MIRALFFAALFSAMSTTLHAQPLTDNADRNINPTRTAAVPPPQRPEGENADEAPIADTQEDVSPDAAVNSGESEPRERADPATPSPDTVDSKETNSTRDPNSTAATKPIDKPAATTTLQIDPTGERPQIREPHPINLSLLAQLQDDAELRKQIEPDDLAAIKKHYSTQIDAPLWTSKGGFTNAANEAIAEIGKADDWGLKAKDFELPKSGSQTFTNYADAAAAELKLTAAILKYARFARGGRLNPSSVSRLFDQTPEIEEPLTVLRTLEKSSDIAAELRGYHPQHPQFEKLRQALLELRRTEKEAAETSRTNLQDDDKKLTKAAKSKARVKEIQIIANMERWRWMPRDLGSFYVWDDVPAQMTRVYDDGKVVFNEKMVVGKASTPTPMFSSPMKFIIFHPSWGVPPGMKRNELAPQLRNTGGGWFSSKPLASTVLRSHGLQVTRNGRPVNPDSIDWSTANISSYHFTQPPGARNVLGIVKFRFPNRHNVYMHDTPERHLFKSKKARTYSHGCMRIENPVRLAEVLLKQDKGWDAGRVNTAKRRGEHITLDSPIPVHIAYFTVEAGEDGKLSLHRDIYGLDNRTASKLEGKRVRIGTTGVATSKRKAKKRRSYVRKKKRTPKKKPFNPFASLVD